MGVALSVVARLSLGLSLDPCDGGGGAHAHDDGEGGDGRGCLDVDVDEDVGRNGAHASAKDADEELCDAGADGSEVVRSPGAASSYPAPFLALSPSPSPAPYLVLCHPSPLPRAVSSSSH